MLMYNNKYIHLPDSYWILYARYCAGHPVLKMKLWAYKKWLNTFIRAKNLSKILTAKTKVSVQDPKKVEQTPQIFDFGISQSWTQSVIQPAKNQQPKFMSVLELKRVIHTDSKKVIVSLNLQEYGGQSVITESKCCSYSERNVYTSPIFKNIHNWASHTKTYIHHQTFSNSI